jgi:hypothetical protein
MSADSLSIAAGVLLSLVFSYIPGLNGKFAELSKEYKQLIMLAVLVIISCAVYGLSCAGWGESWGISVSCDQAGLQALIRSFILAMIGNQSMYTLTPEARAVTQAKASRIEG